MAAPPILLGIYFVLCMMMGFFGRGTRIGAGGVFLMSVIFTPLLVGVVLALARPKPLPRRRSSSSSSS